MELLAFAPTIVFEGEYRPTRTKETGWRAFWKDEKRKKYVYPRPLFKAYRSTTRLTPYITAYMRNPEEYRKMRNALFEFARIRGRDLERPNRGKMEKEEEGEK